MKGLLVVDVQNDFCPGGALAVLEGDRVVPVINALMKRFPVVVASKDWHPQGSEHFTIWPIHCVQGSLGAQFHPDLHTDRIELVLLKGVGVKEDGYTAFEASNVNLEQYLKGRDVDELYVVGLATDYCVKQCALDAARRGFRTFVVTDAIAAVDVKPGDGDRALEEMVAAGVTPVASKDLRF